MTFLHVAALPFPSPQGTQAAIDAMLRSLARSEHPAELLTYGWGVERADRDAPYSVHRLADFPRVRSIRSGPSLAKGLLDVRLAHTLRGHCGRVPVDGVIAHHIEAALAAWLASCRPFLYFAHTSLAAELAFYGPTFAAAWLGLAGAKLEETTVRRADAVAAISPHLARDLEARTGVPVAYVPTPWSVPAAIVASERREAREARQLDDEAPVLLYAGNLDAYQGYEEVLEAAARLRRERPGTRLLIATASDTTSLRARAARLQLASALLIEPLEGSETHRRALHACADVVLVPRLAPGGLPIKLLDALARGVPVVASHTAAAGIPLEHTASLVRGDAESFAAAIRELLADPSLARARITAGRRYVAEHHSDAHFQRALDAAWQVPQMRSRCDEPG